MQELLERRLLGFQKLHVVDEQQVDEGYSIERTALGDVLVRTSHPVHSREVTLRQFDMPEVGKLREEFKEPDFLFFYDVILGSVNFVVWYQAPDEMPKPVGDQYGARQALGDWRPPTFPLAA